MAKESSKTVNKVKATGRIAWMGRNERGYSSFQLVVKGRTPAVIYFVLGDGVYMNSGIGINDYVNVDGYVRAFNFYDEMRGRWTSYQEIIATKIEKADTELKKRFGVEGRYVCDSMFRAYMRGTVTNALQTSDKNWGKITIKVDGTGRDKRPSYVTFSYFISYHLPAFKYEKGDEVCLYASISTRDKEIDGVTRHFENLVIEDIAKIKSVQAPKKEEKEEPQTAEYGFSDADTDFDD